MYQYNTEQDVINGAIAIAQQRLFSLHNAEAIESTDDIKDYLKARFAGLDHEEFIAVYLSDNRLIGVETIGVGTQEEVSSDLRRVVKRALDLNADGVIVAHNHPNRVDARASEQDVKFAAALAAALGFFRVRVKAAFVVAGDKVAGIDPDEARYRTASAITMKSSDPLRALARLLKEAI